MMIMRKKKSRKKMSGKSVWAKERTEEKEENKGAVCHDVKH